MLTYISNSTHAYKDNAMADIQATYRCFFTLFKLGVIKLEDECADYYRGWKVTNKRPFTDEEIKQVKAALVVQTKAGYSVKFIFNDAWSKKYIPVDEKSNVSICEIIDLEMKRAQNMIRPGLPFMIIQMIMEAFLMIGISC